MKCMEENIILFGQFIANFTILKYYKFYLLLEHFGIPNPIK